MQRTILSEARIREAADQKSALEKGRAGICPEDYRVVVRRYDDGLIENTNNS